jgi:ribosome recycling factor
VVCQTSLFYLFNASRSSSVKDFLDIQCTAIQSLKQKLSQHQRLFHKQVAYTEAFWITLVGVQVDYYGTPTPLRQLAGISVPDSTLLVIQPYDKGAMQVKQNF